MTDNQEKEKMAELEAFRVEIGSIVEQIGETDENIRSVKNTKELDENDLLMWNKYKEIFFEVQKLSVSDGLKELEDLLKASNELKDMAQLNLELAKKEVKDSKAHFVGWLNNRNPLGYIGLAVDSLRQGDATAITVLKEDFSALY